MPPCLISTRSASPLILALVSCARSWAHHIDGVAFAHCYMAAGDGKMGFPEARGPRAEGFRDDLPRSTQRVRLSLVLQSPSLSDLEIFKALYDGEMSNSTSTRDSRKARPVMTSACLRSSGNFNDAPQSLRVSSLQADIASFRHSLEIPNELVLVHAQVLSHGLAPVPSSYDGVVLHGDHCLIRLLRSIPIQALAGGEFYLPTSGEFTISIAPVPTPQAVTGPTCPSMSDHMTRRSRH